jgi:hypothetical protein
MRARISRDVRGHFGSLRDDGRMSQVADAPASSLNTSSRFLQQDTSESAHL